MSEAGFVHVSCPQCGHKYEFKSSLAGKNVRCKCGNAFKFPAQPPASCQSPVPGVCPSCGSVLADEAVLCVNCGLNLRTGRQITSAAISPPQPAVGSAARSQRGSRSAPALTLTGLFRIPFTGDLPAEGLMQALYLTVLSVGLLALLFLTLVVMASGAPTFGLVLALATLGASLAVLGWLMRRYIGVVEQYASGGLTAMTDRSIRETVGIVLVIALIIAGPIVAGMFFSPLLIPAMLLASLYVPMAVSMAAVERTLNPLTVVKRIVEMFPGYILVILYIVPLQLVAEIVGDLLGSLLMSALPSVAIVAGWLIAVSLAQYGVVAQYAMMGGLLRLYQQAGTPRGQFLPALKWVGAACVLGAVLLTVRLSPAWEYINPMARELAQQQRARQAALAEEQAQHDRQARLTAAAKARFEQEWNSFRPATEQDPTTGKTLAPGQTLVNSIGMKLAYVPPGQFRMGGADGSPPRPVRLTHGFRIGATEVTQAQWKQVMHFNPSPFSGADLPVHGISWSEAQEFCRRLGLAEGRRYRLPTEAEWEYAARAGTDASQPTLEFGWFSENAPAGAATRPAQPDKPDYSFRGFALSTLKSSPRPVGGKSPNAWGLCDMYGNVSEWCADVYTETVRKDPFLQMSMQTGMRGQNPSADDPASYQLVIDPTGPANVGAYAQQRVVRGGSHGFALARSVDRDSLMQDFPDRTTGLRVVLELAPVTSTASVRAQLKYWELTEHQKEHVYAAGWAGTNFMLFSKLGHSNFAVSCWDAVSGEFLWEAPLNAQAMNFTYSRSITFAASDDAATVLMFCGDNINPPATPVLLVKGRQEPLRIGEMTTSAYNAAADRFIFVENDLSLLPLSRLDPQTRRVEKLGFVQPEDHMRMHFLSANGRRLLAIAASSALVLDLPEALPEASDKAMPKFTTQHKIDLGAAPKSDGRSPQNFLAACAPAGDAFAFCADGRNIQLWSVEPGQHVATFTPDDPKAKIVSLGVMAEGRGAYALLDSGDVWLWPGADKAPRVFPAEGQKVDAATVSPDGRFLLVIRSPKQIRLYDLRQ